MSGQEVILVVNVETGLLPDEGDKLWPKVPTMKMEVVPRPGYLWHPSFDDTELRNAIRMTDPCVRDISLEIPTSIEFDDLTPRGTWQWFNFPSGFDWTPHWDAQVDHVDDAFGPVL